MYRIAVRGRPSHGSDDTYRKSGVVFLTYASRQTDKRTDKDTDTLAAFVAHVRMPCNKINVPCRIYFILF